MTIFYWNIGYWNDNIYIIINCKIIIIIIIIIPINIIINNLYFFGQVLDDLVRWFALLLTSFQNFNY